MAPGCQLFNKGRSPHMPQPENLPKVFSLYCRYESEYKYCSNDFRNLAYYFRSGFVNNGSNLSDVLLLVYKRTSKTSPRMLKRPNIFDCTFDWLVFILFKRIQGELITAARRIFDCRKLWNGYTENRSSEIQLFGLRPIKPQSPLR